jgi:hypothetical protein
MFMAILRKLKCFVFEMYRRAGAPVNEKKSAQGRGRFLNSDPGEIPKKIQSVLSSNRTAVMRWEMRGSALLPQRCCAPARLIGGLRLYL